MRTSLWSVLHFQVDLVCAWAMYAYFSDGNYESLLIYNFCAFALQLPFGTLLDYFADRHRRLPTACASLGALLTVLGAFFHPAILGTGNALFHTGAGIDVIEEDFSKNKKGRNLGIFVAPGAVGLYLGMILGKQTGHPLIGFASGALMLLLLLLRWKHGDSCPCQARTEAGKQGNLILLVGCCFVVVVIRSLVGLSVTFSWKTVPMLGILAVLATAAGKCCGGFLAARYGFLRTAALSLLLSAALYLVGDISLFGIAAIFLFNMSMPLTLYLLAERMRNQPGFAFGLLTFGLFLGFLPVYWQWDLVIGQGALGAFSSVISCILLIFAGKVAAHGKISS